MAFCKYSTEFIANSKTEIDNIFLSDYLPFAQPQFVVVYIYGLYLCGSTSFDNSLENVAKTLNMSEEDVVGAFEFWEEQGLVKVLRADPIQVTYIPLKNVFTANKLFKPDKYETFNMHAQEIFQGKRAISKTEYSEYYDFLERYHVEQEALLMIMQYCVSTKQKPVGYSYILTVARNWANEGITTASQVEERLHSFEEKDPNLNEIFAILGIKRLPYVEERALLNKWLNDFGFNMEVILHIIKTYKKKGRLNFEKLDKILTKYFEMKLLSSKEIDDFEKEKEELYSLATQINKSIGLYYENLEAVVENYILKWINMGFEKALLLEIASYCFKNSIRTLEGMDKTVGKFYKLGLLSLSAFNQYMNQVLADDSKIKGILDRLGIERNVSTYDRTNFKIWTEEWKLPLDVIDYAVSLSKGKDNPIKYLSRVLADYRDKGIKTLDEAKSNSPIEEKYAVKSNFSGRSYSKDEINALFQSIDEIEV